jgi:hypothetical protein
VRLPLPLRLRRLAHQPFPAAALPGYTGLDPRPDGASAHTRRSGAQQTNDDPNTHTLRL